MTSWYQHKGHDQQSQKTKTKFERIRGITKRFKFYITVGYKFVSFSHAFFRAVL